MKIVRADVQSTKVPTIRKHQMAIGTTSFQENVIVRLEDEDGVVGIGEAPHMVGHSQLGETPDTVRVLLRTRLLEAVAGLSVFDIEAITTAMNRRVPGNDRAKGAVVMAAYDLAGKLIDRPVHDLLGGKVRDRIPLSWSLPIVELDVAMEEAKQMVERGWRILKIKAGRNEPAQDFELARRLREEFGDEVSVRVDANQAYDVKTAIHVLRGLEPHGIAFMEQPVSRFDVDGMALLTQHAGSSIPIMADEGAKSLTEVATLCRRQAADSLSIYVIGTGGLDRSKKIAAMAEAFGLHGYVGGALESGVGASAGLHLAASSPAIDLGCEMNGQFLLEADLTVEPPRMEADCLVVPTGPGLGVELDEEKLAHYRIGEVEQFDLTS